MALPAMATKTVLPREAVVKIDMRLVPGQTPDKIYETLRRHLDNHGFEDAQLKHYGMVTPSRTPVDHPYVEVAAQALREGFHEEPVIFPGIGGVAPDFVFTGHLGRTQYCDSLCCCRSEEPCA